MFPPFAIITTKDSYSQESRISSGSADKQTAMVNIPRDAIRMEAMKRNITIKELLTSHYLKWVFGDFDGIVIHFLPYATAEFPPGTSPTRRKVQDVLKMTENATELSEEITP